MRWFTSFSCSVSENIAAAGVDGRGRTSWLILADARRYLTSKRMSKELRTGVCGSLSHVDYGRSIVPNITQSRRCALCCNDATPLVGQATERGGWALTVTSCLRPPSHCRWCQRLAGRRWCQRFAGRRWLGSHDFVRSRQPRRGVPLAGLWFALTLGCTNTYVCT